VRKHIAVLSIAIALTLVISTAALAKPSFEKFAERDTWQCGTDEGFVDNHCLNVRAEGNVLNIKVFEPDPRGPQESASLDARFDDRPCPHDGGSSDGTWWEYAPGLYVCHHSGIQP
jgi:hypothetical protein